MGNIGYGGPLSCKFISNPNQTPEDKSNVFRITGKHIALRKHLANIAEFRVLKYPNTKLQRLQKSDFRQKVC